MVDVVKGSYENPFSMEEVEAKFLSLCKPIIGSDKAENFIKNMRGNDLDMGIKDLITELH